MAASDHLILYPNPSTGTITLQLAACENCACTINVYDVIGKLVFTEESKSGNPSRTFDLSKVSKGVYQVKVSYNDLTQYCKLILQ